MPPNWLHDNAGTANFALSIAARSEGQTRKCDRFINSCSRQRTSARPVPRHIALPTPSAFSYILCPYFHSVVPAESAEAAGDAGGVGEGAWGDLGPSRPFWCSSKHARNVLENLEDYGSRFVNCVGVTPALRASTKMGPHGALRRACRSLLRCLPRVWRKPFRGIS